MFWHADQRWLHDFLHFFFKSQGDSQYNCFPPDGLWCHPLFRAQHRADSRHSSTWLITEALVMNRGMSVGNSNERLYQPHDRGWHLLHLETWGDGLKRSLPPFWSREFRENFQSIFWLKLMLKHWWNKEVGTLTIFTVSKHFYFKHFVA